MGIRLGDTAPDFKAKTTQGTFDFLEWKKGKWAILFSHPKDFTPVCTTELGRAAALLPEFEKRNCRIIGLSVDSVESHLTWEKDIKDVTGNEVTFPMIGDEDRKVSSLYDMIHPNANDTQTVRSVFVIDPENKIRLTLTYPASTGRNFDELLRVLDSLQLSTEYLVSTPADWKSGEKVIISTALSDEEAKAKFPQGFETKKPYLRMVELTAEPVPAA